MLEQLKWQTSFPSRFPVKPCHLFSLCFSSAVSSLFSAVASPPWSGLCLHSVEPQCQKEGGSRGGREKKTLELGPECVTQYETVTKSKKRLTPTFTRSISSFLLGPSAKTTK